jgi:ABC-type bacteriocin/lantibiotic exporter with double-glycine peptidase domain
LNVKNTVAVLALVVLSAGAAAAQSHWLDVPFISQPKEGCGAASVAMVMQYWEQHQHRPPREKSDVSHIQKALYSKRAHGIYASDLQEYLNSQGYATYVVHGDEALLAQHIERGRPLIVALKPNSDPALHYVVVAGIDREAKLILINDPAQRKLLKEDGNRFNKEWQATGNWTLLALPK